MTIGLDPSGSSRAGADPGIGPEDRAVGGGLPWKPTLAGILIGLQDVDLVAFGGGTIRLFDLLSVVIVATGLRTLGNRRLDRGPVVYLVWCVLGIVSVLNGAVFFGLPLITGLLFAVRPVQYLLVGLALTGAVRSRRDWLVFAGIALALILVSVAVDLVVADGGSAISRVGLSYGGPFELACVAGGLAFASLRDHQLVAMASAFLLVVVLSASRITVAVVLAVAAWLLVRRLVRRPQLLAGAALAVIVVGVFLPVVAGSGVFDTTVGRFRQTGLAEEYRISDQVADGLSPPRSHAQVELETILNVKRALPVDPELDRSAMLRFTRWRLLLARQDDQPATRLLGLGPGAGSEAVDGYYVRLLVETGWIGLGTYLAFLTAMVARAWRRDRALLLYLVVLIVSALFVDVLVAAKAMTLLWILAGNRSGS